MTTDQIIDYENGELDEAESIEMFQALIDSGEAWRLQGSYGRAAMGLIESGQCMLGGTGHRDYYGNYIPSRHEVEPGTKGSPEFVAEHRHDFS